MRSLARRVTGPGSVSRDIVRVLALWVKGRVVIWLSLTALYLVGFAAVHTPLWLLLAIVCGLVEAVPHFGPIIGLVLVITFSVLGSGQTPVVVGSLAIWVLVQVLEGCVIGPRVLGRKLGLSPWLILLGGIAGGLIAGPIGLLIATPVMAVIAVIWRRRRKRPV